MKYILPDIKNELPCVEASSDQPEEAALSKCDPFKVDESGQREY